MKLSAKNLTKHILSFLNEKEHLAIFQACVIGLSAGLAAGIVKFGIDWLGTLRVNDSYALPAYIVLPGFGLLGGLIAGFLVEHFAPEASGSGIPQVEALIKGIQVPLGWRVAITKLVSGIVAIGSGLALGREGPTVQVGASLAVELNKVLPAAPEHKKHLIAAGAGAGLAAAFGAPLAGVLFIIEELLKDISSVTLGTATIACFIGAIVSRSANAQTLNLNLLEETLKTSFSGWEIPFYVLLGILAGILGSLFNAAVLKCLDWNNRLPLRLTYRVGLAGLMTGLLVYALPVFFRDNAGLREMIISGHATWELAAIAFCAQFFLTVIAYGSGAPGGLFAPSLVLGAALGYLVGLIEQATLGTGFATTYALAGMGAFFSAVVRVPITAIVIVFEMSNDLNLVSPLMISCIVAFLVGERISKGSIYDKLLKIAFKDQFPKEQI